MRRRLGDAHVARDDGGVDLVAEHAAHVVNHLVGERRALIVHGEHHTVDKELRVEADPDLLDRAQELRQAFQRKEFALQRHEHGIGRGERIDGEQIERRRTIDEDVGGGSRRILCRQHQRDGVAQPVMPPSGCHRFTLEGHEVDGGRHHRQSRHVGIDPRHGERHLAVQHVRRRVTPLVDA